MTSKTKVYYAVHNGREPGIYTKWDDCKRQIDKFVGAQFKKFDNQDDAQEFLENGFGKKGVSSGPYLSKSQKIKNAIEAKNDGRLQEMQESEKEKIYIYTDGSLIRQGPRKLVGCGYGYFIPSMNVRVSKPLRGTKITNNRAELRAIIESVGVVSEQDKNNKKLCIFTDSQYCIYLFTGTGERYRKNNYMNNNEEVPNPDLIEELLDIKTKYDISLLKIEAHTNNKDVHSLGNSTADHLANDAAQADLVSKGGVQKETEFEKRVLKPLESARRAKSTFFSDTPIDIDSTRESMIPDIRKIVQERHKAQNIGYDDIFENYDKDAKDSKKIEKSKSSVVSSLLLSTVRPKNKVLTNTSLNKWFT